MKKFIGIIALFSCTLTMAQIRTTKQVPRITVQKADRDLELEQTAQARSGRMASVMHPEAKAKLKRIAADLVSRISEGQGDIDLLAITKTEIRAKFSRLSSDQADLLSFFVLSEVLSSLKGKLDGKNELSQMTSLRLQMAMDRRSKFISTLSNLMKKISTTQDTLVQNLK